MRLVNLLAIVSVACVTQSCKIEMPSLIALVSDYKTSYASWQDQPHLRIQSAHHFGYSSRAIQHLRFKNILLIGDEVGTAHAEWMHTTMTGVGIPEDQVLVRSEFASGSTPDVSGNMGLYLLTTSDEWKEIRQATRIVHVPRRFPFYRSKDAPRITEGNIVFVIAAGNMTSASWQKSLVL